MRALLPLLLAVGVTTVLLASGAWVPFGTSSLSSGGAGGASRVQPDFVAVPVGPSSLGAEVPGACGTTHCFTPAEIQQAYGFNTSYAAVGGYANAGSGETIVIFDAYGSPNVSANLAEFDATFGLPSATLNIICPAGCPTLDLKGDSNQSDDEISWTEEIALDTQYAHAMAPAATIDLVVAHSDNNSDIATAEEYALSHHLGTIWSQSFGTPECSFTPGASSPWFAENNAIYRAAAAEGITIFASAGDAGAQEGCNGPSANYPADDPYNLAVTGTYLNLTFATGANVSSPLESSPASYGYETTWNDYENPALEATHTVYGVTGGAPSRDFLAPPYQVTRTVLPYRCTGTTPTTCSAGRASHSLGKVSADVAYDAGVDGGVLVYYDASPAIATGFFVFGGTSAGTPQWAAITAIADQYHETSLGDFAPVLYHLIGQGDLHPILSGSNAEEPGEGYEATPGWSAASGVGSPIVGLLVPAL